MVSGTSVNVTASGTGSQIDLSSLTGSAGSSLSDTAGASILLNSSFTSLSSVSGISFTVDATNGSIAELVDR